MAEGCTKTGDDPRQFDGDVLLAKASFPGYNEPHKVFSQPLGSKHAGQTGTSSSMELMALCVKLLGLPWPKRIV